MKDYLASPEHERLEAFHSDVQIETNLDRELLNIKGSSTHLRKTVMNLVSNAAEAQVGGGFDCRCRVGRAECVDARHGAIDGERAEIRLPESLAQ